MEKKAKIFLILSLISILLLLFLSSHIAPTQIKISEIDEKNINRLVLIEGKINNVRVFPSKNFQILTLEDKTGKITVITFSKIKQDLTEKEVIVIGKITEYNKELQINAEKIVLK